jgi:tetratricopeptide (TPR) repeat protein
MVGTQLAWMVGVGLVLVLGFFGLTQWSQQYEWGGDDNAPAASASEGAGAQAQGPAAQGGSASERPSTPQAAAASEPKALPALVEELSDTLDGPVAGQVDSLRALEAEATGQQKQQLQSELVRLYIGAGAPGRAALVQQSLADATGTVEARRRAADLLYQWMRQVESRSGRARVSDVARHVATEYEEVVQKRPQNLDARTRMGEAYLLTNNPMKGIQAINGVLKDDSTFVPARFQKGLALLQINRVDQAVQEFERVKTHADPQNPFYKQAERAIKVINERTSGGEGETGTSSSE